MTRLAYVGDDLTGSVDVLVQARRAGLRGVLVTDPRHITGGYRRFDVVGVATVTRSLPTDAIADALRDPLDALAALDPDVVQYKVCSTADSSPTRGSIGRAAEVLRSRFGVDCLPVCFAQPDFGRWTVFGTHFAAEGDRVHRLDRQPTMSSHPATPMDEADLTVHLGRQTDLAVGLLPWTAYGHPDQVRQALARPLVVADALTDAHLDDLARAVLSGGDRPAVVIASGGLSAALARAFGGDVVPAESVPGHAGGPVLAVSGSCSVRTAQQVDAAVAAGWERVDLDMDDPAGAACVHLGAGRSVVVTSAGTRRAEQDVVDGLAGVVAAAVGQAAPSRVIVCGGDTSGHLLRRLGVTAVEILACPWGNLPLLSATGGVLDGCQLVLKGGQMGAETLFEDVRTR